MSRSILKQSSKIGAFALMSRCIAFMREIFLIRFFSVGDTSDIFFTAIRIPNTMRKIFAEGSLSSVLVPAMINAQHTGGTKSINRLTTFSFVVIETLMLMSCVLLFFYAYEAIHFITPGFAPEKVSQAAQLLRILISFIIFISSGSIFAANLQAQQLFFIPALAPSILNVLYVASLMICLYFKLSVTAFCGLWIITSVIFFLMHIIACFQSGFEFSAPNKQTITEFKQIFFQFLPCFISVGIMEINNFINTGFCSYLPSGSLTLLRYAFQFVNVPIGIITASLVTVLLPHFSKLHLEQPKELARNLFDAIKFVIWTTLPIFFLLAFFSHEIFHTLFLGDPAATSKISIAQSIFIAYLTGLMFFSLNKVFLAVFYALRLTMIPLAATAASIGTNYYLNRILMQHHGAAGIALASSVAALMQTIIFIAFLGKYLHLNWSPKDWGNFLLRVIAQLICCCSLFWILYVTIRHAIAHLNFDLNLHVFRLNQSFFLDNIGIWVWTGPLGALFLGILYTTRKRFGIHLSYFDER